MSEATQYRDIDGMRFSVTKLLGMRGLRMSARLFRLFGPALSRGLAGVGKMSTTSLKNLGSIEVNMSDIGEAIALITTQLSENELEAITRELLENATVDNKPLMPIFDVVMQGKTLTILKVLKFAFEVNYGSFLGAFQELAAQREAKQ